MSTFPAASPNPLHPAFLAVVPRIERHGRVYFRGLKDADKMEEAIAEMVALSWKWFLRLVERGRDPARFPSAIAAFAARAVHSGRRLCGQERAGDVLSPRARRRRGFAVQSLPDHSTLGGNPLGEALVDNTVTPVDEQVAFRLDFPQSGRCSDRCRSRRRSRRSPRPRPTGPGPRSPRGPGRAGS